MQALKAALIYLRLTGRHLKMNLIMATPQAHSQKLISVKNGDLQPEVLWNQQATRTSSEFDDIYDDGIGELKDVKLNYLSIPLLLSYSPSKFFTLQAGPQVGILLNKDETSVEKW